jgi:hypothetical protein
MSFALACEKINRAKLGVKCLLEKKNKSKILNRSHILYLHRSLPSLNFIKYV